MRETPEWEDGASGGASGGLSGGANTLRCAFFYSLYSARLRERPGEAERLLHDRYTTATRLLHDRYTTATRLSPA